MKLSLFFLSLITAFAAAAQNSGDLLPIAYRMNATGATDEVLFVCTNNLAGGTVLQFTDAKFTTNAQAQCAGGLTWTAPAAGLPAGSVISIKSDLGIANPGAAVGSTFGLSSSGDQCIVYFGPVTSPTYITALSSKAWTTGVLTTCSGSNSILPSTLSSSTSISLASAPGNVSSNSTNAYFKGSQIGSWATLRDSITNPLKWIAAASGTAPQTWPAWNFPGPPAVTSAYVKSSTEINVVFSRDMNSVSATNLTNYSGLPGLSSATMTQNGSLSDTVTLSMPNGFSNGSSYSLLVSNVIDAQGIGIFTPFNFTFSYQTAAQFSGRSTVIQEGGPAQTVTLTITNPSNTTLDLLIQGLPWSTASSNDVSINQFSIPITPTTSSVSFTIGATNDILPENDEYFVVKLSGVNAVGPNFFTTYIKDNDKIVPNTNKRIELAYRSSFKPDTSGSTCEVVAHDPASQRIITNSAVQNRVDISDFSNPDSIVLIQSIDMTPYGGTTSVAVRNGLIAVASPDTVETNLGKVVFFNSNGNLLGSVQVGALPDMITFTPNGQKLLVANEGQPNDDYSIDPQGSISIIDVTDTIFTAADVTTVSFNAFDNQLAALKTQGYRNTTSNSTLSQDAEPEYITVSNNSQIAWVTLQENNAIARVSVDSAVVTHIFPLGTADMMSSSRSMDASDQGTSIIHANWPTKQFFIPDALAQFSRNNLTYLITANEGDEREYSALNERSSVSSLTLDAGAYPNAAMLKESHALGRFRATNKNGDTDGDGDIDQIHGVGSRSFSIWNASTGALVYDSGDLMERYIANHPTWSKIFNSDSEENKFKARSRSKGPEPEGVAIAEFGSHTYAFVAAERIGGVFVFGLDNPVNPEFIDYVNTRNDSVHGGDLGPETLAFVKPQNSPDGMPYILVANEISGTVSVFEIQRANIGLPEEQSFESFAVYPNPTNGLVQFKLQRDLFVTDLTGTIVYRNQNVQSCDLSNLPSGVYFVHGDFGVAKVMKF
jgi:hypothetical protein